MADQLTTYADTVGVLCEAYPDLTAANACLLVSKLIRLARRAQRNALMLCNDCSGTYKDKRQAIRRALEKVGQDFGVFLVGDVSGDPRAGSALKLSLPIQRSNSFGGEGWIVPL